MSTGPTNWLWAQGPERTVRLIIIVVGALAILLMVLGLVGFRAGSRARYSTSVDGQIVSSRVTEYADKQGTLRYRPMVVFAYSVDAARFMSNRITVPSYDSSRRDDAERVVRRYPPQATTRVFYDPYDPEQAVLEPGANPWVFIALGGLCALTTVALRQYRARLAARPART